MKRITSPGPRRLAAAALTVAAAWLLRRPLLQAAGLAMGGAAAAFALKPLSDLFERRLSRPAAALAAVAAACGGAALLLWLTLPTVLRELQQVWAGLPRSVEQLARWTDGLSAWAESRLPGVALPAFPAEGVSDLLSGLATKAARAAGGLADGFSRLTMALMLGYFFLCDRDRLLLRLELLVPQSRRTMAVRAGRAVLRELRLYLCGQLMIVGAVGALAAAGLALIGMRSALVLGGIVGVLNMVPYFGPIIGGAPAALIALSDGPARAAACVGVLALVQQADAALLSPRIMGSLTGFSPAAVLLAIYAGGSLGGIVGMLTALPMLMTIRTLFRFSVQSCENI